MTSVTSTQRAGPGPLAPAPICARPLPRTTAAVPPATRPTCTIEASTPYDGYRSSSRGAISSSPDSVARAASTAARAASSNSIGTTIPGSTIDSLKNNTGTDLASAINPPKFSQIDSTLEPSDLFPELEYNKRQGACRSGVDGRLPDLWVVVTRRPEPPALAGHPAPSAAPAGPSRPRCACPAAGS